MDGVKITLEQLINLMKRANDPQDECGELVKSVIMDLISLGFIDLKKIRDPGDGSYGAN